MTLRPPKAAERPHKLIHHGRTRVDPFYWLRADNWQAVMRDPSVLDAEIRAYLDAENAYADAVLAPGAVKPPGMPWTSRVGRAHVR